MLKGLLFFAGVIMVGTLSENLLRRKLDIPKTKGLIYRGVSTLHRWTERIMLLIYIICLMIFDFSMGLFLAFIILFFAFRTYMEWRYEREKKEYLITMHFVTVFPLLIAGGYKMNIF
ncbi:DUF4181 domain-containing protein [Metabacillus indicus]|uniref:DUF4181 domain-containing protein n=1 Tax=Metabacillus indicus TaxID=246786 RepID=UPI00398426DD